MKTRTIVILVGAFALLACLSVTPAFAQGPDEQRRQDIQERIRERFSSLLRSELSLSDEQAEIVLPAMSELEQLKAELGRDRRETARALQRGMQDGASDDKLQGLLDRLEKNDDELRTAERTALAEIDAELNVRQRVKLRFFVQRFREQIRDRMGNRMDRMERMRRRQESPRNNRP